MLGQGDSPKSAEGSSQEYPYDQDKLFKLIMTAALIAVVGASPVLYRERIPTVTFILCMATAFFGAIAVISFALRLSSREPGLIVSEAGIRIPAVADGLIAWKSIVDINRSTLKKSDFLKLTLEAAASKALARRGLAKLSGRTATVNAPLSQLVGDPNAIAAQCEAAWRAARAASPTPPLVSPAPTSATPPRNWPWLTYVLLLLLIAIFTCELAFAVNPNNGGSPSVLTLAYMGGILGSRVWQQGEWWRLFTGPLLHAGVTHILFNGIVLWSAGTALERLVGWRWLGALFALSALGGAAASLLFNAAGIVGVGASGGIMGLLGALFVMSFRLPFGGARTRLQMRAAQTIVPALLPIISASGGVAIDYAAHGGGLAAGVLFAAALLKLWRRDRSEPPFGYAAAGITILFFAIAAGSLFPIVHLRAMLD